MFHETERFTQPSPDSESVDFVPLDSEGPLYEYWVGETYGCAPFPPEMEATVANAALLEPKAFAYRVIARDAFGFWRVLEVGHLTAEEK